ncbi:hypothetical protein [Ruminococcus flavefaciens]|uniref:hypothetical protein n=1 Tax=Ruminococcus flavefaciens TaxID=1265 RepID=UPI000465AD81|nr:hypothetical protein [Ruminococcus flavefaciens]
MYRLRHNSIKASSIDNTNEELDEMVSLEQVKEILCEIEPLNSHDINVVLNKNGHLVITVDDVTYETT